MKPLLSLRSLLTLLSLTLATHAGASTVLNVDFKTAGLKDPKGVKWLTNSPGLLSLKPDNVLKSRAMVFEASGVYAVALLPQPISIDKGRAYTLSFRSRLNQTMELRFGLYQVDAPNLPDMDGSSLLPSINSAPGFYVDLKIRSLQVNAEAGTYDTILYGADREFGTTVPFVGSGDVDQMADVSLNFSLVGDELVVDSFVNGKPTGTSFFKKPDIVPALASAPFNAIVICSSVGGEGGTGFAAISTLSLKEVRP